ncbi:AlpA family phage regulatory protein [uncultured Deefgea sp.]|uniref:AlpA family phage regulatory protein n=1 Tax=uncultured Deefgea sp. TaxID=1304914 RepID=UPI0025956C56|nr:AlpA family phage regulatory protein [uncultured Deefgea sp.]
MSMPTIASANTPRTMERLPCVLRRTGLSRSSIYNLLNPRHPSYDPSFPEQIQLSQKIVAWDSAEITAWLESKISAHKERKERDDF